MKDLVMMLLEKMIGKDFMHYKLNIQLGVLIILALLIGCVTWYAHSFVWQWNNMKDQIHAFNESSSNVVVDLRSTADNLNTISAGVIQEQKNQVQMSRQFKDVQNSVNGLNKNVQRIDDFIEDKFGNKMDYLRVNTNGSDFAYGELVVVTNAVGP